MREGRILASSKRTVFLVNSRYQVRFALMVTLIVFISSLIYPVTIVDIFNRIGVVYPEISAGFQKSVDTLIIYLIAYQLIFLSITFIICIFITHKTAGPIYKLMSHFQSIRNGAPVEKIYFRSGDHFPELADETNQFIEHIQKTHQDDYQYLDEVISYISNLSNAVPEDKRPVINEICARLRETQTRLSPHSLD